MQQKGKERKKKKHLKSKSGRKTELRDKHIRALKCIVLRNHRTVATLRPDAMTGLPLSNLLFPTIKVLWKKLRKLTVEKEKCHHTCVKVVLVGGINLLIFKKKKARLAVTSCFQSMQYKKLSDPEISFHIPH